MFRRFLMLMGVLGGMVAMIGLCHAQIEISGPLSGVLVDTTYVVTDDISVEAGDSLIIEPGAIFQFVYTPPPRSHFHIYGYLNSTGTENDSIKFMPESAIEWGGFIFYDSASDSSVLAHCLITGCIGQGGAGGGGIMIYSTSPTIKNCLITDNTGYSGGGIYCTSSGGPTIENCIISGNHAFGEGGGIRIGGGSPIIIGNTITENSSGRGGGIYVNGSPVICDNLITDNHADSEGGGIYCSEGAYPAVQIAANTIIGNSTGQGGTGYGGGIYTWGSDIYDCVICNNSGGGGIYTHTDNVDIVNCTISNNTVIGIRSSTFSAPSIKNCIIADNNLDFYNDNTLTYSDFFNCTVTYLNPSSPPPGFGEIITVNLNGDSCDVYSNLFQDPLFVGGDDYNLTEDSPCIDAGDPNLPLDPDNTIADMGALYFPQANLALSADSLEFPATSVGYTNDLPLKLYNIGTVDLIIAEVALSNPNFTTDYTPEDSLIGVGDSLELTVSFSPDSVTLYGGLLAVNSTGGSSQISLSGEGIPIAEVELDPIYEPIFISPWGGDFGYYIRLNNNTGEIQNFDLWIDILLPDSSLYGPVLLREDITLTPSSHLSRLMVQEVPAGAPEGRYINQGHIGNYSTSEIWDEDAFVFTKVGYDAGGGEEMVSNWNLSGWDNPESDLNESKAIPQVFSISAHPNPFNPVTWISFSLPEAARVTLRIFNVNGRQVSELTNGWRETGMHEETFDGSGLASGIYIYRLQAGNFTASGKMMLIK